MRRHTFPPSPPIATAAARLDVKQLVRHRAQESQRCRCGKVCAYSVDEARAMVTAIAQHVGHVDPVWFYLHGRAVHWTRVPQAGTDPWTPTL